MPSWAIKKERIKYLRDSGWSADAIAEDVSLPVEKVNQMLVKMSAYATSREYTRCPGCGYRVLTPCLICAVRER
jgi:hypothetical protein